MSSYAWDAIKDIARLLITIAVLIAILYGVARLLQVSYNQFIFEQTADCSYFANRQLGRIPVRCVEYYGLRTATP